MLQGLRREAGHFFVADDDQRHAATAQLRVSSTGVAVFFDVVGHKGDIPALHVGFCLFAVTAPLGDIHLHRTVEALIPGECWLRGPAFWVFSLRVTGIAGVEGVAAD